MTLLNEAECKCEACEGGTYSERSHAAQQRVNVDLTGEQGVKVRARRIRPWKRLRGSFEDGSAG